jgi:hypothetical protein
MSDFDAAKDYYAVLGADRRASRRDLERLYKRKATDYHPDRGGSEEQMKALNEAYRVLKNERLRQDYDAVRSVRTEAPFAPVSKPAAAEVGLFGQGLSALLCLLVGLFLLFLVRAQWFWFLWPLGILSLLVIALGIMMARSTLISISGTLPGTHLLRRHSAVQEVAFWLVVILAGYALYMLPLF